MSMSEMCTLRVTAMSGPASVWVCRPDTIAGTHARTHRIASHPSVHVHMHL